MEFQPQNEDRVQQIPPKDFWFTILVLDNKFSASFFYKTVFTFAPFLILKNIS